MKENFDRSCAFILSWEGTYSNDPDDPGGETNYGISKRSFPNVDIKALTKEDACKIYRDYYWSKVGCDTIEWPMDLVLFDTAVNMGVNRALLFQQEQKTWQDVLFARIEKYANLASKNPKYLRGWINRVISLWKMARK